MLLLNPGSNTELNSIISSISYPDIHEYEAKPDIARLTLNETNQQQSFHAMSPSLFEGAPEHIHCLMYRPLLRLLPMNTDGF